MKYILLITLFLPFTFLKLQAQSSEKNCYYGITFEMSTNPNWGNGEPVITEVEPASPAEEAGIKVGDIIMEINGNATYLRDNQTIARWLFNAEEPMVHFTVRNMNTHFKEYPLLRKCIAVNSVSEKELADLFSFYSLENTNQQSFVLPLEVEPNSKVDFADYHTFDFYKDEDSLPIDENIEKILQRGLEARGLVRDTEDPDIIVQTYFSFEKNPDRLADASPVSVSTSRFDTDRQRMVALPIYDIDATNKQEEGEFIYEIGFGMYDKKYLNEGKLTQIWDCSIKDYVKGKFSYEEYVRIHVPLLLMQFPYTTERKTAKYTVSFSRYNYTGIHFNADNLLTISDVEYDSPAYKAGVRPGHILKKVDNKTFDHTKEALTRGYKQFVSETMPLRDSSTRFTHAQGYDDCMFWDSNHYSEIAKAFSKAAYYTHFSYLYGFEKYVNNKQNNKITFEVLDGRQHRIFTITPIVHKSVVVKAVY